MTPTVETPAGEGNTLPRHHQDEHSMQLPINGKNDQTKQRRGSMDHSQPEQLYSGVTTRLSAWCLFYLHHSSRPGETLGLEDQDTCHGSPTSHCGNLQQIPGWFWSYEYTLCPV